MSCKKCGGSTPGWMGYDAVCSTCVSKENQEYYKSQEYKDEREREKSKWSCNKHPNGSYTREEGCWDCLREADEKRKNKKGCFITTATLKSINSVDDFCFELQEFRRLRDTYVQKNHPEYVTEYYQVAPIIVENINKLEDSTKQFSSIWNDYLKECLSKTVENNLEEATKIYKKMVDDLKIRFIDIENQ